MERRNNQQNQQSRDKRPGSGHGVKAPRTDGRMEPDHSKKRKPNRKKKKSDGGATVTKSQSNGKPEAAKVPQHDYSEYRPKAPRRYALKMYDTFIEAKSNAADIKAACATCDQLNVVIRAEGDMKDPDILAIDPKIAIFAGAAWWLIHERRIEEKWFESAH